MDPVLSSYLLQIAHFQQGFRHLGQAFRLLLQQGEEFRRLRQHVRVFGGKQFQLGLHQCQGGPQLVGGIASELALSDKGIVQTIQHLVEGMAELAEFRQRFLVDSHIRQIVQLYLLHLGGKAAQGSQGSSADEIGQNAAK